jgi:hypothetical protein
LGGSRGDVDSRGEERSAASANNSNGPDRVTD